MKLTNIILTLLVCNNIVFAETTTNVTTTVPASAAPSTVQTTITQTTDATKGVNDADTKIVSAIYDRYAKDSAMTGTEVKVTCQNGLVTLSGSVTAQSQADQAVIVAKSIPGVKDVQSTISVATNPNANKTIVVPAFRY